SGSALITDSSPFAGDGQGVSTCAGVVTPGVYYEWGGSIFFPGGQAQTGDAQIGLRFKDGPGCTGADLSQPRLTAITHDTWVFQSAFSRAPVGAASVQFVAFTSKVEAGGALSALFDHLFIQANCPDKARGDVNADTNVDVGDVFALVN